MYTELLHQAISQSGKSVSRQRCSPCSQKGQSIHHTVAVCQIFVTHLMTSWISPVSVLVVNIDGQKPGGQALAVRQEEEEGTHRRRVTAVVVFSRLFFWRWIVCPY